MSDFCGGSTPSGRVFQPNKQGAPMKVRTVLSLLFALLGTSKVQAQTPSLSEAILQFEQLAMKSLSADKASSMAVAVTYKGEIVYSKTLGSLDIEQKQPAGNETLFRLASVSKIPTAIAILQLWERGQIDIDQPLVRYLPWFKQEDPAGRDKKITIRQILNHTAGLARETGSDIWNNIDVLKKGYLPSSDEMRPYALKQEIILDGGLRPKYSNLGFWILAQVIAEQGGATGSTNDEKYANYVQDQVLKPMGLKGAGFVLTPEQAGSLAVPYGLKDHSGQRVVLPKIYDAGGSQSAWGLYGRAIDMGQLLIWIDKALSGQETGVLKPETVKAMITGAVADPVAPKNLRGLGLHIVNDAHRRTIGHGGWFTGYVSSILQETKSGIGIAVSVNSIEASSASYWSLVFNTIGKTLQGLPMELPTVAPSKPAEKPTVAPEEFKKIVGRYTNLFARFTIEAQQDGSLKLRRSGELMSLELISKTSERIDFRIGLEGGYSNWIGERMTLTLNPQGEVTQVMVSQSSRCYRLGDL